MTIDNFREAHQTENKSQAQMIPSPRFIFIIVQFIPRIEVNAIVEIQEWMRKLVSYLVLC
jgi:hypothetical protein